MFQIGLNLTYESMCPYQKMLIKGSQLMISCTISDSMILDEVLLKRKIGFLVKLSSMTEENEKSSLLQLLFVVH